jgi:hypothetical protein
MTPRSEMGVPSPATLRMRKSRERRRQGDVIVKLEIGPKMTANLVSLGWVLAPDRVDKDALARSLVALIDRAITMRATPSTMESESVCFTPLRVITGQSRLAPMKTPGSRRGSQRLSSKTAPTGSDLGVSDPARFSVQPTA